MTPLSPTDAGPGPFAALTLGRVRPRSLLRFVREGARLGPHIVAAPGLVTACSAGIPLTGNCTLSIWESEEDMLNFACRDRTGHGRTVRRDPPILAEQLNARMRLRRVGSGLKHWAPRAERLADLALTDQEPVPVRPRSISDDLMSACGRRVSYDQRRGRAGV